MSDNSKRANPEEIDLSLLANFTHQVINPLNGIAGTLDNLVDGTISEQRKPQRTKSSRAQLESVITTVRNLAYLSSPNFNLEKPGKRVALPEVIIEAAMFYQEHGASKGITIDLLNQGDQNLAPGHPEAIRQVLMNLFDNAVKYSRVGSQVVVKQWIQKTSRDAMITVRSVPENNMTEIDFEKMFEIGFRGKNALDIIASGTGLGLYICKHLMKTRLDGSISVGKDKDGIVFELRIPNGEAL